MLVVNAMKDSILALFPSASNGIIVVWEMEILDRKRDEIILWTFLRLPLRKNIQKPDQHQINVLDSRDFHAILHLK